MRAVFRILLLVTVVLITLGLQFASLSPVINNQVDTNPTALKNYINYYVNVCGFAFSAMVFVLGKFFTSDIPWHLDERPGSKRFNKAWGLSPGLLAVRKGYKIGGKRWILTGLTLTLVACFSLAKDIWLTHSIDINPFEFFEPMKVATSTMTGNQTISDICAYDYLSYFVSDIITGSKGVTALHNHVDGEYMWVPWIVDPNNIRLIEIEDYVTISLRPNCTLLRGDQVTITNYVNLTSGDGYIRIDIPGTLYDADPATLYMYNPHMDTAWNATALPSVGGYGTPQTRGSRPGYFMTYQVFASPTQFDAGTAFTFQGNATTYNSTFKAYVYGCRINVTPYTVSALITSQVTPNLDRVAALLNFEKITNSTNRTLSLQDTVAHAQNAFDLAVNDLPVRLSQSTGICLAMQCWMFDSIPGISTGYNSITDGPKTKVIQEFGWKNMTSELLEYKLAQALGYLLSPRGVTVNEEIQAKNVTQAFVTQTVPHYIYLGVGVEFVLILLAIGVYVASVTDFSLWYGDDIDHLAAMIRAADGEHELAPLKED